jgi:hypothetical protein
VGALGQDLYPVTIVRARYGGTYEPGKWIAFPLYADNLPDGYADDDVTCATFWSEYQHRPAGGGDTPDAAYADLLRQVREGRK